MNRAELERQGYYTINKLMELTGNDRRTISKKLKGQCGRGWISRGLAAFTLLLIIIGRDLTIHIGVEG
jgi:hypothetical protein